MATNAGPPDFAAAYHSVLQDKSLQFAFPRMTPQQPPPWWLTRLFQYLSQHGAWFRYAGWTVLGILVLAALYYAWQFRRRAGAATVAVSPVRSFAWQPSTQQARLLLRDADRLAQEGHFDEAAHLLLLVSIQEIRDQRPGLVLPALTSREIGQLETLTPRARSVFSEIAQVVERCIFGAHPLGAADFTRCRQAFEQFAGVENWQAAP